jgi:DNA polymerase III subunit epsilon
MECLREKNLAIADVETSGTHAASSRIIEIGILRIEDGKCVETYRSTVNPGKRVPVWITALTGITQEEVNTAPFFEEIIDHVERLTQDAIFVAHNVAFDYSFLEREFARHGRRFSAARLCTARLSRTLFHRAARTYGKGEAPCVGRCIRALAASSTRRRAPAFQCRIRELDRQSACTPLL